MEVKISMGLLDRLRTKHEKINPETGKFEQVRGEPRELTREEQFAPRKHPWQTPDGKRLIKDVKGGVRRFDRAIVNYNRRQPKSRGYSIRNNYNPFGTMFDTGMTRMKQPKSKGKKYVIRSGKAYPVVGTGSKKKKTGRRSSGFGGYDTFDNWGFMR
jgi:hypothetical protein